MPPFFVPPTDIMETDPLTYDRLKAALPNLKQSYKEYVAQLKSRDNFCPEFDSVYLRRTNTQNPVAIVSLFVIEEGFGSKKYTKEIHYGIHMNASIVIMGDTVWGKQPEAVAYSEPVAKWSANLFFQPKPSPPSPKMAWPPVETTLETSVRPLPRHPSPPPYPKPNDKFCPKGAEHLYSEPRIGGYSWHGPVYSSICTQCGYVFSDH